jgi:DNA polymerase-3 subunit gamma/tau
MSLYRRHRPAQFDDVIGQDAVVSALRAGLLADRLGHALLLTGPRGVGKTTLARLIAKGVNCQKSDQPTDEPCGECPSCSAINSGSSPDVLEMDAASNRGVDDARALRERLQMSPMANRRHVFIIDEAHMLTREAQNALLKSLEEPPAGVHFIFATTAVDKLLDTIRSRCHRFALRRPDAGELGLALSRVAEAENLTLAPDALSLLCTAADGSFRDALTLLDQLVPMAIDNVITSAAAERLTARPSDRVWGALIGHVAAGDGAAALSSVRSLSQSGYDLEACLSALADFLRLVIYGRELGEVPAGLSADEHSRQAAVELGAQLSEQRLWSLLQGLDEARRVAGQGGSTAMALEVAVLAATRDWRDEASPVAAPAAVAPAAAPTPSPAPAAEPVPAAALTPAPTQTPEPVAAAAETPSAPAAEPDPPAATGPAAAKPAVKSKSAAAKKAADAGIELPGPAVASAAFPLLKLALRSCEREAYLAVRTAWARYDDGRLVLQFAEALSPEVEREAKDVVRRMVNGSVRFITRPKPKPVRSPAAVAAAAAPAIPKADMDSMMGRFGLTPLDGDDS